MVSPVTGSAEVITASVASMPGMLSASTAYTDHTSTPLASWTRWAVGTAGNGYAARMRPPGVEGEAVLGRQVGQDIGGRTTVRGGRGFRISWLERTPGGREVP